MSVDWCQHQNTNLCGIIWCEFVKPSAVQPICKILFLSQPNLQAYAATEHQRQEAVKDCECYTTIRDKNIADQSLQILCAQF